MDYLRFRKNVFSQNGEDGILEEVLVRLGLNAIENWCVEFGAWDGKHMSNTFQLVSNHGWNGVYIEGNADFYKELEITCQSYPKIIPILRMISHEAGSTDALDMILGETDIPKDFEVLSIDIDSYDLAIWANMLDYTPKVVIIEINSHISPGILEWHHTQGRGNSFSSTLRVGTKKGYTLICHTGNMIFVRNDLVDKLELNQTQLDFPETLFDFSYLPHTPKKNYAHILRDFINHRIYRRS
jgi:hypothetical protein